MIGLQIFHSTHSDLLFDIADTFDFSFSHSTYHFPTRYADNGENLNSVIDLMCYNSKTLEQINGKNLVLELIQENLIENSV